VVKTEWKSEREIEYLLRDAGKVSVLSCGGCASLLGTGGKRGLRIARRLVKALGKEVVFADRVIACCWTHAVRQVIKANAKRISDSDVLIVLSCGAGVKSAWLSEPGVPVITLLDTTGSVPITDEVDPVARSVCTACGHCVIGYTGGICPLSECPAKKKYEPCEQAPKDGGQCVLDPARLCVWHEIAKRGDLAALKELRQLHKTEGENRLSPPQRPPGGRRRLGRKVSVWMTAGARILVRLIGLTK